MRIVVDSKNPFLAGAAAPFAEVRVLETSAITREAVSDADAIVVRSETRVSSGLLDGSRVQFVGTATIGTDHVDMGYLSDRGISFASAPGSNANSVAEYVATALLVAAGRFHLTLQGKTLGVVGVGNVGSRVARVGEALGMHVLKNDPPLARQSSGDAFVPLDALMEADIVTLHVPLTRDGADPTFHLFDAARIRRMKRGAFLVNTSRGGVIESGGLMSALQHGHLGCAILDVWEDEPDIDVALLGLTVLGTPHVAGYSFDGKVNAARMMFEALAHRFGWNGAWEVRGDMPPPRAAGVVAGPEHDTQTALLRVLTSCYDIEADDLALRGLIQAPAEHRGAIFRRLRSSYPVRREFAATSAMVPDGASDLANRLKALGFTDIRQQEGRHL